MASDNLILLIPQFRRGRLENPSKFTLRPGLAAVDLQADSVCQEDDLLARRSLDRLWDLRSRLVLRMSRSEKR
jgi:hypothetical protein